MQPHISDPVKIYNGHHFEKSEGLTKAEFFEKHGFVLLTAPTVMEEHDWLNNSVSADDGYGGGSFAADSPLAKKYGPEVLAMIDQLYEPGTVREVGLANECLRRGIGAPNGFYGYGVHTDLDNVKENFMAATRGYQRKEDWKKLEESEHFESITFWRPVAPMKGPIRRAPLAVLDAQTVKKDDTFTQIVKGGPIPEGLDQYHLYLRRAPEHKWFYYPDMTLDQVLVMKQIVYKGPEFDGNMEPVFHSAFELPDTTEDDESRQSAEYRISVFF
jgi:hypothetical protein